MKKLEFKLKSSIVRAVKDQDQGLVLSKKELMKMTKMKYLLNV